MMLAQAISFGDLSLFDLIFKTILQLPQCSAGATWGCVTGVNFAQDFIYGVFLPHIVILFFLYLAIRTVQHAGIGMLIGIGIYTYIVYSGLYPLFASLTMFWLVLTIFLTSFYFFFGKVIHPTRSNQIFNLFYKKTRSGAEKRKIERSLEQDIGYLRKELKNAKNIDEKKSLREELTKKELELREIRRR